MPFLRCCVMTSLFRFTLASDLVTGALAGLATGVLAACLSFAPNAHAADDNPLAGIEFNPNMSSQQIQDIVNQKIPPLNAENEWGCTCLLCLANPNGWKSVGECVPPVKRLFRHLRKGKPMPRCPQADESQNYIKFVYNPVNPCSKMGLNDVTGYISENRGHEVFSRNWTSWGDGDRTDWQGPGTSYCVGDFLYTYRRCIEREHGRCVRRVTIKAYDKVVPNPMFDPIALDVTIEGKYWHRVHEF